jgi:hypothetical protein
MIQIIKDLLQHARWWVKTQQKIAELEQERKHKFAWLLDFQKSKCMRLPGMFVELGLRALTHDDDERALMEWREIILSYCSSEDKTQLMKFHRDIVAIDEQLTQARAVLKYPVKLFNITSRGVFA